MTDLESLISKHAFGGRLSPGTVTALGRVSRRLRRTAGTVIQLEGAPAESAYIVVSGHVRISRSNPGGREQVIHVVGAGEDFNTVPIFDGGLCPATATALTDVELLVFPRDEFIRVVERHSDLALGLLADFAGRQRHLVRLVEDLSLKTVQGRLAGLLIQIAQAAERGDGDPPLTQAEMAARLGTVREMVGRSLKSFEALGLIQLDRGVITILDPTGLTSMRDS